MKVRISNNKYVNALLLLMLFSAGAHMVVLFYKAIATWDFYVVNYVNILDIPYFYPDLLNNVWGNIVATLFAALIYIIILKLNDCAQS